MSIKTIEIRRHFLDMTQQFKITDAIIIATGNDYAVVY